MFGLSRKSHGYLELTITYSLLSLQLFGVMVSCSLRVSERFYGTGESFMFSFNEEGSINVFHWTGINDFIVKGSPDSIAFGSGE